MRVTVKDAGQGLHPNEIVVQIETIEGPQFFAVDKRSLQQSSIEIAYPVAEYGNYRLIELPVETSQGAWRVWVDVSAIKK
jgi:hypothetical protein